MAHAFLSPRHIGSLSVLTVVLFSPLAAARADAAEASEAARYHRPKVVVRVYESSPRSPELTASLEQSVSRLLESVHAKVDVTFVDCALPEACGRPAPDALVLRVRPGHHPLAARQCGEATLGKNGQRGVLMTIFRDCIAATRHELRTGAVSLQGVAFGLMSLSESDILGAIVVHELIHLVLPDEIHGKGLFKATLDARDWMEIASGWPQLDSTLVSRLDRALTADEPVTRTLVAAAAVTRPLESTDSAPVTTP